MLSLQLRDGDYLTIGDDIVVQVFTNSSIQVHVQAPKDMTILRGELLERSGMERPQCLSGPQALEKKTKQLQKKTTVSNG